MSAVQDLISRYEKGAQLLEEALRGVPPEILDRVPAPGKWTIRQIAIHLGDSELVIAGRIRAIAGDPGSGMLAFNQEHWADNMEYQQLPVEAAIKLVRAVRESTAALLRALPESAWTRTGFHNERGEMSLKDVVETGANHAENHARQIREHRARFAAVA